MKKTTFIIALGTLLIASCNRNENSGNLPKDLELTTKSAEFIQKGHSFAFELIDRVNDDAQGSYIISPLSLQFLLGMVLDGARGETADEICQVLGYIIIYVSHNKFALFPGKIYNTNGLFKF